MLARWFYSHDGKTHGPLSVRKMQALAEKGEICAGDLVWQDGSKPEEGLPAEAVLDLQVPVPAPPAKPAAQPLPDWLEDVKRVERRGPAPLPQPSHEAPEWLEDLRLWVALDWYAESIPWDDSLGPPPLGPKPPGPKATGPAPADAQPSISRSVEDWQLPGEAPKSSPSRPRSEETPASPTPVKPAPPIPAPPIPPPLEIAKPVAPAAPAQIPPAKPMPAAPPVPPQSAPPTAVPEPPASFVSPAPPAIPVARLVAPPVAPSKPPAPPSAEELLVDKTVRETGFNPRTGQIVDGDRFKSWKQEQARAGTQGPAQAGVSNATLFEVFRRARTAVENWLDEESIRSLVLARDDRAIREHPEMQALFKKYEGYGAAFRAKLLHHLEFMTENRAKYYTARPKE